MKTAIITGTSSGIGQLTAEQLIEAGWKVYGMSRTQPSINHTSFVWVKCDLASSDTITSSLKEIIEPSIDLLVSNAGVAFEEPASAATHESYTKIFSVNVLAPMLLVNALKDKITHATIISVSSVSDRLVEKDFALYCSSKAANTRYFESLADELINANVFTLLPDYVDTPMLRELQAGRDFEWDITIKPRDVAKLTVDLACGNVKPETGSNIIIVTNGLKEDLESREKLYGFNTDTNELFKL
jgi:NAD(P)-dependent dehydrogenase (short-subunit alcohol dehydrogenase family)